MKHGSARRSSSALFGSILSEGGRGPLPHLNSIPFFCIFGSTHEPRRKDSQNISKRPGSDSSLVDIPLFTYWCQWPTVDLCSVQICLSHGDSILDLVNALQNNPAGPPWTTGRDGRRKKPTVQAVFRPPSIEVDGHPSSPVFLFFNRLKAFWAPQQPVHF